MELTDALLEQWEPKIHRILQTTFILGMDRDDIAQELRIAIIKAAQHFDETKGASFHTYLHTVMMNTIRTFISKAQKTKNVSTTYRINGSNTDDFSKGVLSNAITRSLIDKHASEFIDVLELKDILDRASLSAQERDFLELRMDGATMEQISGKLDGSAYKLRASLQKKVYDSLKGGNPNEETLS
tara:strand:- start:500 stop:1054 length:555 start_codon:yes stop_codon:yes gene_type:complete